MAVLEPSRTERAVDARGPEPAAAARGLQPLRADRPLVEALAARGRRLGRASASRRSARSRGGEPLEWGRQANENPPVLRTHDRYGNRIDEVEFHPPGTS